MSIGNNEKLEPKDLPSRKDLNEKVLLMEKLVNFSKALNQIGLTDFDIESMKSQIESMKNSNRDYSEYMTKYNRYFSEKGWIVHDSMDFKIVIKAVDEYEKHNFDHAEEIIQDYYSPSNVEKSLMYLEHIPEFRKRFKFLEYALEDYKSERYYAVIPILLMIIDGVISDILQKGFHAETIDLKVWDSITSTDTGIITIQKIFTRSRNKTDTQKIDLPYRNGILHGRDLGYDNYIVACKSWAFIFFIRDWILSKRSEKDRIEQYIEKSKVKSFSERARDRKEFEKMKKLTDNWKPRIITSEYISELNNTKPVAILNPESLVLNFLDFWKRKNYGKMAELFSELITDNYQKHAGVIRKEFQDQSLLNYEVVNILDEAAAISEIEVKADKQNSKNVTIKFRCIYEKGFGHSLPRGMEGANWKIISINLLRC